MSLNFVRVAKEQDIRWANATRRIPLEDNSVEVIYSSHIVEHLDHREVRAFLREAHRVLAPKGVIRIAVPDVSKLISTYLTTGDADEFVGGTLLATDKPKSLVEKFKYLVLGPRHHHWMYDGASMTRLLASSGFVHPEVLDAGKTTIPAPGNLDLHERQDESVYVEATKS